MPSPVKLWKNFRSGGTPLSAEELNIMEELLEAYSVKSKEEAETASDKSGSATTAETKAIAAAAAKATEAETKAVSSAKTNSEVEVAVEKGAREAEGALKLVKSGNLAEVADAGSSRANVHVPALTPVLAVATSNIATLSGLQAIDGGTPGAGAEELKAVLLTAQTESKNNGIWNQATGAWTRPTEFAEGLSIKARTVAVTSGTVNAHSEWLLKTATSVTIGTTSQVWEQLLPISAVTDARGVAAGDLLLFSGSSFVRFPRGEPGEQMVVTSTGEVKYERAPSISVDAWGAKTNGENATVECQAASEALVAKGGGTLLFGNHEYVLDGFLVETGVNYVGYNGDNVVGTRIKAKAASTQEGIIECKPGRVRFGSWQNFSFKGAGNAGQDIFYLHAQEVGGIGGVTNYEFLNCEFGSSGFPAQRNCMWLRGGAINTKTPMQFITFNDCTFQRANTGSQATTSRGLKCSGQCAKITVDGRSTIQGNIAGTKVGTNVELTREFLLASSLTAEAKAGATKLKVGVTTGLENGKVFSVGEGATNEICKCVGAPVGEEVTVEKALKYTHAIGVNTYLLSGTVASPTINAPVESTFYRGAYQNSELDILADGKVTAQFFGCDFEEKFGILRAREEAIVDLTGKARILGASEGVLNGQGLLTEGSNVITGATKSWVEGELIGSEGPGIPPETTVTNVSGSTITISNSAVSTGSLVQVTNLTKGGKGKGYIASLESGAQSNIDVSVIGTIDNYVLGNNEGYVYINGLGILAGGSTASYMSEGVTVHKGAAETITTNRAREIVLTNAAATVKNIKSLVATGELIVLRATVAKTLFGEGGNLYLQGNSTLEIGAGGVVVLLRTDYGPSTFVLVHVTPATGVTLEPSIITTSGTYAIPATAKFLRCVAIGGGGGGGGAGSAAATQLQAGGGGAAAGTAASGLLEVGANTEATVTVGEGGEGGEGGASG